MPVKLGARWDDPIQNDRIARARDEGLLDYIEVNYPIPLASDPNALDLPVLAHTSSNPTCSIHGINPSVARLVKKGADRSESPWIGEHLTWLGSSATGSLGYQINPLFTRDFLDVAVENIARLKRYYGREVALELSPIYVAATDYESEMHFLDDVAAATGTMIILDVTHWQIANKNLGRPARYGLDALAPERIVELHVAGMRQGSDGFWHDAHQSEPDETIVALVDELAHELPNLQAVTLEHHPSAPEEEFFSSLQPLNAAMHDLRPGQ